MMDIIIHTQAGIIAGKIKMGGLAKILLDAHHHATKNIFK